MSHNSHQHRGGKGTSYCVCPKCGYSIEHKAGNPCRNIECSHCKINLIRSDKKMISSHNNDRQNLHVEQKIKSTDYLKKDEPFPKVIEEKCTGCQNCISICPNNAIVLKDDKAFVIKENCSNCRVCIRFCPENALVLE